MNQFTLILIPFEKITYETSLNALEIKQRLDENTISHFGKKNEIIEFKGKVGLKSFKLTKDISYMNSFKPVIIGKIIEKENTAIIRVWQRLSIISFIFLLIWTIVAIIAFFSIFQEVTSENWYNFLFVFFGYFITIIGFKTESIQIRIQLQKLLNAKLV